MKIDLKNEANVGDTSYVDVHYIANNEVTYKAYDSNGTDLCGAGVHIATWDTPPEGIPNEDEIRQLIVDNITNALSSEGSPSVD